MKSWSLYRPLIKTMIWSILLCAAGYVLIKVLTETTIIGSGVDLLFKIVLIVKVIMISIPAGLFIISVVKIWRGNTFYQNLNGYILSAIYAFILFCGVLMVVLTLPI
jgi:hypothetical protein